jgi:hypothetical protein
MMPRSLTSRPFAPALPDTPVRIGLPAVRPNPHAETFARILREEAARLNRAPSAARKQRPSGPTVNEAET